MYTWDINNWQHRNMLEHRRRQIAHIDFVKNSKQRATILKSRTTTRAAEPPRQSVRSGRCTAVGDVGGRCHGVR